MKLSAYQKKYLKSLAHDMPAFVTIGKNGLTAQVIDKVESELDAQELIKIKILDADSLDSKEAATLISQKTSSMVIKVIGKTIILFRENPENKKDYFKACGKFGQKSLLYKNKE